MKVLIADDSAVLRFAVAKALRNWGYADIVEVADGSEAIESIARNQDISIAILDWQMPELDGTEVCRRVRELSDTRYVYVIMLTSNKAEADVVNAMEHGADDYVVKSSDFEQLRAKLHPARRIVELHKRLREEGDRRARAERMESVGNLAAGVGHELNTPLQYILQNAEYLQREFSDLLDAIRLAKVESADFKERLGFMLKEVPMAFAETIAGIDHAKRIVSALRDFSSPAGSVLTLANLNEIVQSAVTLAEPEWKYVAQIQFQLASDLREVNCLPQDLSRAVLQLLLNASQAIQRTADKNGCITITTSNAEHGVVLEVADSGDGINPDIKEKVFDPFFRVNGEGPGLGHGLAFVYAAVVQRHKGTVEINSKQEGGTSVRVQLPVG